MSIKTTKKEIIRNFKNIIVVSYCELQDLLYFKDKDFYTCGVYGWNASIYKIDNQTVVCTGYRPFGNIEIKREITKKYNSLACEILSSKASYEEKKDKINNLLDEFIKICLQEKMEG